MGPAPSSSPGAESHFLLNQMIKSNCVFFCMCVCVCVCFCFGNVFNVFGGFVIWDL